MCAIILKLLLKKKVILLTFLIIGCLLTIENVFSLKQWNRDYMEFSFNNADTSIIMNFEFYDYDYGPSYENGFLEYCDFYFSHDSGRNYTHFMTAATNNQARENWSWVNMSNKLAGIRLQFIGCYVPASGSMWSDNIQKQTVEVYNKQSTWDTDDAWLTVKWFLGTTYKDVYVFRIIGKWHVNGIWPNEYFDEIYAFGSNKPTKTEALKSNSSKNLPISAQVVPNNNSVKVYTDANALVIKGVDLNENIKVFTTSGLRIKSIIANNNIVNIKLPKKQMYIVHVGQLRYYVVF